MRADYVSTIFFAYICVEVVLWLGMFQVVYAS